MRPFDDRRVLLVVCGGIAAYKSAILVRALRRAGARVDVVLTESAERFVGATTFEALSGRPVHGDLWARPLAHVELGRESELAIVAPATADILARMMHGLAGDMAAATLLAAACPVLACPAMNSRMWEHPATRENFALLRARGVRMVGPETGELAEGETGPGRMAEPDAILAEAGRLLEPPSALRGRRVVVTAGPTRAPLDPVRYLGNRSSGRMGYALAAAAWRRGAETVLITGPATAPLPYGPRVVPVEESGEMLETLRAELAEAAVLVMAAAVSDYAPPAPSPSKRKREGAERWALELVRGPDLLAETRELRAHRSIFTLGFALETEDGVANARAKLASKGIDLIALNEAGRPDAGFGSATNRVTLIDASGVTEEIPLLPKTEVAERLLDRVAERIGG